MTLTRELSALPLGKRTLPSQVYEKDVFFYSPTKLAIRAGRPIEGKEIEDSSPEYSLEHLADRLTGGATFVVFVNRVVEDIKGQTCSIAGCLSCLRSNLRRINA
jgi:hypothetical protein